MLLARDWYCCCTSRHHTSFWPNSFGLLLQILIWRYLESRSTGKLFSDFISSWGDIHSMSLVNHNNTRWIWLRSVCRKADLGDLNWLWKNHKNMYLYFLKMLSMKFWMICSRNAYSGICIPEACHSDLIHIEILFAVFEWLIQMFSDI